VTTFVCTGNAGKIQEYYAALGTRGTTNLVGIDTLEEQSGLGFVEPEENYNFFLGNALLKLATSLRYVADTVARGAKPDAVSRIIVDDSGLCVPALGFEPGVHSAYYGGQPRSAEKNRQRLKEEIAKQHGASKWEPHSPELRLPAFFVCFILSAKISHELLGEALNPQFRIRDFLSAPLEQLEQEALQSVAREMANGEHAGGAMHRDMAWKNLFTGLTSNDVFSMDFGYCLGEVSTVEQNLIPGAGHGYDSQFYAKQHPKLSFASVSLEQKNGESHRALAMNLLKKL
jgi:inosine/xanthosine triphosphate pyrophosphatase family protein